MRMNYFVVGTTDMERAAAFYDAFFDRAEVNRVQPSERMIYWLGEDFAFAVAIPFDGRPAANGNGTMVGFALGSAEEVERLHRKAISLGGTCEGAPGPRGPRFSAYVRDPDGNKICLSD
ncbi:VOC family protein [Roseibacterium sp. SDUM158016]|uniref:VOC family protein n=1 Tax=Roseicyclus sediminis TaxID=2980997 RepID=UPI0021D36CC1|nr:VOC family protein [Roseibacterium sp. SDUM158016]MCU4654928.1 VOC family protein [Roseibacterium sp. SDUM158016]